MKRIVIIDHFSQTPDEVGNNRFLYLAELLNSKGYQVEIVTTDFSHKNKATRQIDADAFSGLPYQFTMLPEPGYPKNVCIRRFWSHHRFGRNLYAYLKKVPRPDLVFAAVPSLDAAGVAATYCRKTKVPYIVDVQDLWPEAFRLVFNIPIVSSLIFSPMMMAANRIYGQADKIVAVSDTYKNRGLQNCKKDAQGLCVFLGTDLAAFDEAVANYAVDKPEGETWIAYAGTLGHSYNIQIVLDALNLLPDQLTKNLVFKVLGDGPLMERFKESARECKVRVDFLGRVQYAQMGAWLKSADIAVNPIAKGAAQSIINKHADYAASGLPVISTQECPEYRQLLDNYECGINCDPDSPEQVALALERLLKDSSLRKTMGAASRRMAEERFDRATTYQQIVHTIEECMR